jgi:hypothetical protein
VEAAVDTALAAEVEVEDMLKDMAIFQQLLE